MPFIPLSKQPKMMPEKAEFVQSGEQHGTGNTSAQDRKIREVIILGNHIQALGIARMAAGTGRQVVLYNDYGASVTRFSKACREFHLFRDKAHLLTLLLQRPGRRQALIIATNDNLVGFMADHYEELADKYLLAIPSPASVQICFNKRDTYRKAMELGIPIPESHFPDSRAEVEALAGHIRFPVVLKPAIMYKFHGATGKKVFFCKDRNDLVANYERILQIIPPEEVIVQQFLTGGAKVLYSFGSFFAGGEVYGSFVANRIRQKPMDFGISTCFAHTVINPELEKTAEQLLRAIDYFGLSEVEFMYDEASGQYRLLEVNPRAWKWHSIANKLGIDLVGMMLDYLEGNPVTKKRNDRADVAWVERLTDLYVVSNEIRKGRMTPAEYLRTMRMAKESAAWSWRDPVPAIMYILMAPYLLIKRNG